MELCHRERLSQLVEELTTSGQPQLNQDKVKELKKISKVSNDCIDHVYHSVMSQLNQEHAEIRLSAFQIACELFSRSHHFRTLLVDNLQGFLELTVETDTEQPLPPPKEVARKLRSLAIQTVQSWQTSYGSAYKKLELGYHFLKQVKKVDFQDAEARTVAERRREEERQRKMARIYKARVEAAAKDMEESYQDIEAALTEMESCMKLLFPEFGLIDLHTGNSCPSDSQPDKSCRSDDEEPRCSRNLTENKSRGEDWSSKVEKVGCRDDKNNPGKESTADRGMMEKKGSDTEEENGERRWEDEREEDQEEEEGLEEEREGAEENSEEEEDEGLTDVDSFIRSSGLISHTYSLDVNLSPVLHVKETEDNEPVVSTMMELHRLISTKHLPAVQGWVQVFTKSHAEPQLLRRALSLKKSLEAALHKHEELHIDCKTRVRKVMKATSDGEEEEDDDDEFEEVPEKEGYEPHIPEHLRAEYGLDPSPSTSTQKKPPAKRPPAPALPPTSVFTSRRLKRLIEEEQDPTSSAATLRVLGQKIPLPVASSSSSSTTSPGLSQSGSEQRDPQVPVVPFGLDLYYWGQEQPSAGKIIKSASQHQFWVPAEVEEEVENQDLLAQSKSRYISFPGNFVPVSHFCRAPLGNGTLCQRQDRVKCPFHGLIIPRDQEGRPCREEDQRREEQEERRKREQEPDWRDEDLMRDIEAATGEDLGSSRVGGKKRKGKKKKYPNLSDLKQSSNTSRSRLERKVFNKSTMRRVAQVLSKADRRKHDKFSNQFNYALN
ncbi:UV-stimulated scaffold protein A isoform X2 [Girardinichthys multiradiatus]|uniref:UV-stimulated scaffold protein A isoform X2 n=1 Tax=Girardinichthys multiradiatus TaxID=208333 RepID=UPI001FAB58BF|nr:UV-stimulated scaffold protein A isoform X2 [Girardinichthys multiradiatus]